MSVAAPAWARQPQINVRPNYSGLGAGVQIMLLPFRGALLDVAAQVIWTPTNNAISNKVTPSGMAASFDGVDDYFSYTGYPWITGATGTFFMWAEAIRALDTNGSVWFGTNTGANAYFHSASNIAYSFGTQCTLTAIPSVANTSKTSLVFSAATTAGSGRYFQNGVTQSAPAAGTPTAFAAGAKTFNFGRWNGGATWDVDADIVLAGFTNRAWGEDEAKAFHENPWQMFAPEPRRVLFLGPAVAGGATVGRGLTDGILLARRSLVA